MDFSSQKADIDRDIWAQRDINEVPVPTEDFLMISQILRTSLKLNLFGFDILIDEASQYWLVDVNYFPSYKNVVDIWPKFLQFFLGVIGGRRT
jgi:hypothetical protein